MTSESKTADELRLTAAMYAARPGVVDHVRRTGHLPKHIDTGGASIQMRLLIEGRGRQVALTEDERLVYEAILRDERLPGGGVILVRERQGHEDGLSKGTSE